MRALTIKRYEIYFADLNPAVGLPIPGDQGKSGNGGYARQGLPPEPEGADGEQILIRIDFAGGVTLQGKQRIVVAHADAIVGNTNQGSPPVLDIDHHAGALGVDCILQQFLDNGSRPFDHLAGGDLVGKDLGKNFYSGHGDSKLCDLGQDNFFQAHLKNESTLHSAQPFW